MLYPAARRAQQDVFKLDRVCSFESAELSLIQAFVVAYLPVLTNPVVRIY